jgi:hypothetical protein
LESYWPVRELLGKPLKKTDSFPSLLLAMVVFVFQQLPRCERII